jgi:tetrahydromethanopterin S-methyltransferase subunit E
MNINATNTIIIISKRPVAGGGVDNGCEVRDVVLGGVVVGDVIGEVVVINVWVVVVGEVVGDVVGDSDVVCVIDVIVVVVVCICISVNEPDINSGI